MAAKYAELLFFNNFCRGLDECHNKYMTRRESIFAKCHIIRVIFCNLCVKTVAFVCGILRCRVSDKSMVLNITLSLLNNYNCQMNCQGRQVRIFKCKSHYSLVLSNLFIEKPTAAINQGDKYGCKQCV